MLTREQITELSGDYDECKTFADIEGFARAIEALVRAECVPQWVSVSDRLPEKHTEVLVAFKGISLPSTGQYTGHPRDVEGWCYPSENNDLIDDDKGPVVTHWMPLPLTPHEAAAPGITAKDQS